MCLVSSYSVLTETLDRVCLPVIPYLRRHFDVSGFQSFSTYGDTCVGLVSSDTVFTDTLDKVWFPVIQYLRRHFDVSGFQ
jgi:hypothetical protein